MVYQSVTPGTGQLSGKNVFQIQMVMEEPGFHQNRENQGVSLKHNTLKRKDLSFSLNLELTSSQNNNVDRANIH